MATKGDVLDMYDDYDLQVEGCSVDNMEEDVANKEEIDLTGIENELLNEDSLEYSRMYSEIRKSASVNATTV